MPMVTGLGYTAFVIDAYAGLIAGWESLVHTGRRWCTVGGRGCTVGYLAGPHDHRNSRRMGDIVTERA
jgi:hypothetical protein